MAEERIEIPVTPERTNLKGGNLRNSMGKSSMSSSREKIIPHYLRASTGSCHDFCKYGRKHAFETKGKHHIPRGNTTSPAEGEYPVNSATLTEKKKKPVIKLRRSSDPVEGGYPINSATLAETKKKPVIKPRRSLDLVEDEYPVNSATLAERKTKPVIKLRRSSDPVEDKYPVNSATLAERKMKPVIKPRRSSDLVEDECPVNSATLADRKTKPVIKLRRSPDLKTQLLNKAEIIKPKVSSPDKTIELSAKQVFSPAKRSVASTKPATALKSKSVATKSSSFPMDLSGGLGSRRNNDIKIMRNMGNSKTGGKKALMPQTASVSPRPSVSRLASLSTRRYRNLKAVSPLKNQNKVKMAEPKLVNPYEVREKTLYVIEQSENKCLEPVQTKTPTRLSPSSLSSSSISSSSPSLSSHVEEEYEESELTHSEANDSISEYDEIENKNQIETMNAEHKRRGRGTMVVQHEDKDCSPQKLNFRRGKVINLQTENNGPRRLRFRQGRMLGENQNGKGEIGRRSFRRRKEAPDGDLDGTKPKSEQVVLRHQDLQGKKDAQGLFNNVIEETASKLVETRKSKVKALVGAFETVISLQESKPTTTSTG